MAERFTQIKADSEKEQLIQLVGFKIEEELFGVDILMVQEIIRNTPITHVPNSPDFVEGVINLRGSIIPVIDLRKRLNLHGEHHYERDKDWILILDISGRVTGFIVDLVTEVLKIQQEGIEPPPEIIVAGLHRQYIRGVCEIQTDKGKEKGKEAAREQVRDKARERDEEKARELLILLNFEHILLVNEIQTLKALNFNQETSNA